MNETRTGKDASGIRRHAIRWYLQLIRRKAIWIRIPVGILLIVAGAFGFLPVLGFWMIPIGVILIGRDIPFVRRLALLVIQTLRKWQRR
ncbi:MAG: hypothetical protein ACREFI_03795 [Stellaceae bacterium]